MTQEATPELQLELPDYHGRVPSGMKTSIGGSGNRLQAAHGIGDRIVIVIEAKVRKAGHEETDDGLLYTENLKTIDLFELPGIGGTKLLQFLRSSDRAVRDLAEGKIPLPEMGEAGWTDASGVVLTKEELADRRGDPLSFLTGGMKAAVIVYEDGARALWPEEFAEGANRPELGSVSLQGAVCVEVLDAETGEPLEGMDPIEPEGADDFFDIGEDDVPPFDVPLLPDEQLVDVPAEIEATQDELERQLPTSKDFESVDRPIPELKDWIGSETFTIEHLQRLLNAEKQGRGRGLKPRAGAIDVIFSKISQNELVT